MKIADNFIALFEGLKTVFMHLFRNPITLEYPEKKADLNSRFRGRLALQIDEHNKLGCIGCRACIRVCPCIDAIKIESEKVDGEIVIKKFEVDISKCIQCGNCTFVCPKNVLTMSCEYELANCDKTKFLLNKGELTLSCEQSEKAQKRE